MKNWIHPNRIHETIFLFILCCLCFTFSLYRVYVTETRYYLFLNWNLFLAFIPWMLTTLIYSRPKLQQKKRTIISLLIIWLIFFPNAPYIFTDLFHLRVQSDMPIWFDLTLILSFAWTGMLFGFLSLRDLEKLLKYKMADGKVNVFIGLLLFITGFGIYLGRYLRWNSWDVIHAPGHIFSDVGSRLFMPWEHPRTWGMTIFMGLFLNMVYWSLKLWKKRE